ncbi:MAG: sigma-70 family RNA polymerase sigma factor [Anaerolineales bacterium]|nr:sigma-70 family RNA polymerase sigma factor [Anaerolineales bacterium]
MDEAALIQAARQGDLDAFNRLVLAYQDMVYNQAYRMMSESEAAEDAAQDAFISAFRNLGSYRGGSFKAWLLRIVTNLCYDELRRRKRRPTTPLEPVDQDDEEIESPRWLSDPGETPEETVERAELARALQRCLEHLPDDFRAVVVLVDLQGMDYMEAAQAIGNPLGTVKSRLARARLRLRDCLQGFWELLPAAFRLVEESDNNDQN